MKLIPKDAVVTIVEERKQLIRPKNDSKVRVADVPTHIEQGWLNALTWVRDSINSLEVKEVDLEKELTEWHKKHFSKKDTFNGKSGFYLTNSSQLDIAKHFFELGMRVNNPITAADRGTAEEIIINLKRVEQDYHINLTKEIEWVRNQVKKGEEYDCK